ncbi:MULTISPECIES: hypothetical protein [unclassified Micromonospora]|uniref:hypothetical protein n=1 Tax=unclassified Micromonospora TaxID=2617518 RepID=UPI002FF0798D
MTLILPCAPGARERHPAVGGGTVTLGRTTHREGPVDDRRAARRLRVYVEQARMTDGILLPEPWEIDVPLARITPRRG